MTHLICRVTILFDITEEIQV